MPFYRQLGGDLGMSSIVCGGFTLLGALMIIGGTTQKVAVTGVLLIAVSVLVYALINDEF